MRGSILETVGLEFEGIGLTNRQATNCIVESGMDSYLRRDRDASVEFRADPLPSTNLLANDHTQEMRELRLRNNRVTMGYEIKTTAIPIRTMEKVVWNFLPRLECAGDFTNRRAALHVHVGFGASLKILKRLISFGVKLDPLLFRMAGMGTQYRGEFNHSTYCRPLVLGPVVLGETGNHYRILNTKSAIKAGTTGEFWEHYALDITSEIHRYVPARYFALNLYAIPLHGTLEFRHMNQSLNPLLVISMVKFLRGIAELIFYAEDRFFDKIEPLNVFKKYSDNTYENMLIYLIEEMRDLDLDYLPNNKEMESLIKNIYETPHHNIVKEDILTHINGYYLRNYYIKTGFFDKVSRPKQAGQVDIHNIGEFSILD